jgi:hypothetical protein
MINNIPCSCTGEEIKYKSFAAKDTAKEKCRKYYILTNPLFAGIYIFQHAI